MIVLLIKITILLLAGWIALAAARRSTPAMRHLLCLCTFSGSLLLPAAALLPSKVIAIPAAALATVVVGRSKPGGAETGSWVTILAVLWAAGTAFLLLRLLLGYWRVARMVSDSDVSVPLASGLFRPKVTLPRAADKWPDWQREAAIRHENAHIDRRDLQANLVANLACALYWFHPLAWAVAARMRREQEAACDDAVVQSGFDAASYAEALLAVARNSPSTSTFIPGCSMTTQANFKSRIVRLLDGTAVRRTSRATLTGIATAFAGILLVVALLSPVRADEVHQMGDGVSQPRVVYKVDPQYTEDARRDKISGPVTLSLVVGADGLAHDISVIQPLDSGLDVNAAEAVEQWRFAPGMLNGEAVAVRATIVINFRLL
jgi:TonB family protein